MTKTATRKFRISAIPADELDRFRAAGRDVGGAAVVSLVAEGGEPLRCCLRGAESGEDLILFGYRPPIPDGPYRELGPVFAHGHACEGPVAEPYPSQWRGRPQVLRAYDARGWIHPATRLHDGSDPEGVISEMLLDPDIVQIHSRNVAYGCYMFSITRAEHGGV
jgi:hypothetical protein